MWIYQHRDWPNFSWDGALLAPKLADIRHRQGLLLGKMQGLGFEVKQDASLTTLTRDIVKTSAIEGETLNVDEVRSSLARRMGMDIGGLISSSRHVEGIVEMMLDATQQYQLALTEDRLFAWHAALFPTARSGMQFITVGHWRPDSVGPMQVVSGAIGRERVHFEAPPAADLPEEVAVFLNWFNSAIVIDPVVKAAIAHLWFVTLHPFEDGNGRIARAIADMALARADQSAERFYSMSSQIEVERKAYYQRLEAQQRGTPEITSWLNWFLDCLGRALQNAESVLATVLFKSQLWRRLHRHPINARQRLVLNRMLDDFQGHMNTSKYAKLAKCSTDTALRDIRELLEKGALVANLSGGRSRSYRLITAEELALS